MGPWPWPSGNRPWRIGRLARPAHGGHVTPRDHGDSIPVMLSPGMPAEKVVAYYGKDLALKVNKQSEAWLRGENGTDDGITTPTSKTSSPQLAPHHEDANHVWHHRPYRVRTPQGGVMDEMVAWLRGVLDEDETAAEAATPGPWESDGTTVTAREGQEVVAETRGLWAGNEFEEPTVFAETDVVHIARHDPRQVLADVAAKREVLDAYTTRAQLVARAGAASARANQPLEYIVRTLASAYRDRPGWKREWEA